MTDPKSAVTGTDMAQSALHGLRASAAGITRLQEDVRGGKVRLEEGAGEQLKQALSAQIDRARKWLTMANRLEQGPPLGTHWVGAQMSQKMANRVSGDQFSFSVQITQYVDELNKARDIVDEAIRATKNADSGSAANLGKQKK
ncbi:hypothetical protein JOF53_004664 [Crossiella equi]|uniref:Phasin protein n=1 Tax=Crossiella equi TaxID=130796 RepID=A0ABS5AGV4_9PSEU|nr:hypothetical protein [Crossiella equi]MBP2475792.1 hypothetical protein [Crossiella equi]